MGSISQSLLKEQNAKKSKREVVGMKDVVCVGKNCNRLLGKKKGDVKNAVIEVKCPLCGTFNYIGND